MAAPRIALIADSLALPRPGGGANRAPVHHTETYPAALLRLAVREDPDAEVVTLARRNRLMTEVPGLVEEARLFEVDAAYVHVGICDCAPRVLSPRAHDLVERLPELVRRRVVDAISRNRRRILLAKGAAVYTPPEVFGAAATRAAELLAESRLRGAGLVAISPPDPELEHRSPGYDAQVRRYNGLLAEAAARHGVAFVDLYGAIGSMERMRDLSVDGQHLNAAGNELLAGLLWDDRARG